MKEEYKTSLFLLIGFELGMWGALSLELGYKGMLLVPLVTYFSYAVGWIVVKIFKQGKVKEK